MDYDRELLSQIVQMVLKELERMDKTSPNYVQQDGNRLLVLLSGGMMGAQEARSELRKLRASGHRLRVLFTPSGESVLGESWLREDLPDVEIISTHSKESPLAFLQETDMVLIPVLTFNTAAKIACGIADNLVTSIIMQALLQGKPIIAAKDACNVANPHLPQSPIRNIVYRNQLMENVRKLEQIGIQMVTATMLSHAVDNHLQQGGEESDKTISSPASGTPSLFYDKILSLSTVTHWSDPQLIIKKGTIVTPAAKDLALERGIRILTAD